MEGVQQLRIVPEDSRLQEQPAVGCQAQSEQQQEKSAVTGFRSGCIQNCPASLLFFFSIG